MATVVREIRAIPLWVLREYLVELGGTAEGGQRVAGPGWVGQLLQLEDVRVGSLRIGEVRLELTGDAETIAGVQHALEPRLLRAGG